MCRYGIRIQCRRSQMRSTARNPIFNSWRDLSDMYITSTAPAPSFIWVMCMNSNYTRQRDELEASSTALLSWKTFFFFYSHIRHIPTKRAHPIQVATTTTHTQLRLHEPTWALHAHYLIKMGKQQQTGRVKQSWKNHFPPNSKRVAVDRLMRHPLCGFFLQHVPGRKANALMLLCTAFSLFSSSTFTLFRTAQISYVKHHAYYKRI